MKIKRLFLCLTALNLSMESFAQSQLELLWQKARDNSVDLLSASYAQNYASLEYKKRSSLFPFSLKSSVTNSFNDIYSEVSWYPSSGQASLTVSKVNPFGNTVSATLSYGATRGILNYFAETIDREVIGYSHSPELSLSIEQSLFPAIKKGSYQDVQSQILKEKISLSSYEKDITEKVLISNVTSVYIQARCSLRDIKKYKNYVDLYDKKIEATKELLKESKVSVSSLWSLENSRWDYYKNYIDSLNSLENICLNLKALCGEMTESITEDSMLPTCDTELFDYCPERNKILLDIENLKLEDLLRRQKSAPVLSFESSFSENTDTKKDFYVNYIDDKSLLNWSFTLGVNFSPFLSPSKKLSEISFNNNLALYQEKLKFLDEQSINKKKNYDELINKYQEQVAALSKIIENRKILYEDYKQLYTEGKCSFLDYQEIGLTVTEAECIHSNLSDYLWLYKWMRAQEK